MSTEKDRRWESNPEYARATWESVGSEDVGPFLIPANREEAQRICWGFFTCPVPAGYQERACKWLEDNPKEEPGKGATE